MKKKAIIYNFHFQNFKDKTGYDHNVEIPYDEVFDIAKKALDAGLNIMITSNVKFDDETTGYILYVDNGRFRQK